MEVTLLQDSPSYCLQHAVLLYGVHPKEINLVTMHPIVHENTGPVIKEGTPATKSGLVDLLISITDQVRKPLQVLNQNIIAISDDVMIWWEPAQSRRISFSCKELGNKAAIVSHPPLLFSIGVNEWSVHALRCNERPTAKSAIAVSPYFNVDAAGNICTGSTLLPKGLDRDNPDKWTKAFYQSAFTHPGIHGAGALVRYKTGPFPFWRDMLNGKFENFPMEVLVPTGLTVQDVIEQAQGNRHAY